MADPGSLENCCACKCTVGSNPTPSAIIKGKDERKRMRDEIRKCSLSSLILSLRGSSSVGRASVSQSGGRGFESHLLHYSISER